MSDFQPALDLRQQAQSATETFGTRLGRLRVTRRLSQMQLATNLNVSVPAISA